MRIGLLGALFAVIIYLLSHLPAAPAHTNQEFGLSVGNAFAHLSAGELNSSFDDLRSLGVAWLRFDVPWNDVQPAKDGSYNWSPIDRIVSAAKQHDIKLLPILLYTPSWARLPACKNTDEYCSPADPDQFAEFAQAAARQYAPQGVHYWEIWNEPNVGEYWGTQGNIIGYAKLLIATSIAIHAVDPSAYIVTGGMSPATTGGSGVSPIDFLKGLYARGAGPYFNAVGHHPYTYAVPADHAEDSNAWLQMSSTNPSLRSIMAANGDGDKQIWSTEYGAPTGGPGALATMTNYLVNQDFDHVTEELQSLILTKAVQVQRNQPWSGPLFWYSYKDAGTSPDTNENFFGLIRYDGAKKPAYGALQQILSK